MIFGGGSVGQNRGYSRKVLMSQSTPRDNGKRPREEKSTYFSEEDLDDVLLPHEDPLVIQADIGPTSRVERMIVDSGSSADILYMDTFIKMGLKKEDLSPCKEAIYGFTNVAAPVAGVIDLKVSIGSRKGRVSRTCRFIVVEVESTFHGIFGRPFIHGIKAVPSSYHQCIRYPINGIIATVKGSQKDSRQGYKKATQLVKLNSMLVHAPPDNGEREKLQPVDETEVYQLKGGHVALGKGLDPDLRAKLVTVIVGL